MRCVYLNCREPGIWQDEDGEPGEVYCGAHLIYVDDESAQKRTDFADEYKRDADREARS